MKKRLLAILMAVAILFSLSACGILDKKYDDRADMFGEGAAATDKASKTKEIIIPGEIMALAGHTQGDDLTTFIEEGGYSGAKWNDDGTVTVTMKTADFEKMQQAMFDEAKASLDALVGAEGTAFITALSYSENLEEVTVTVINADYVAAKEAGLGLDISVGVLVNLARYFTGEAAATIKVIDSETGDEIEVI